MRSLTNGIVSAANLSLEAIGGGDGAGAAAAGTGAGVGVTDGDTAGTGSLLAEDETLDPPGSSSLVKYRKPAPMATRHTTVAAAGHIQFDAVAAPVGFFFICGME
jgi:hypothetical protein